MGIKFIRINSTITFPYVVIQIQSENRSLDVYHNHRPLESLPSEKTKCKEGYIRAVIPDQQDNRKYIGNSAKIRPCTGRIEHYQ